MALSNYPGSLDIIAICSFPGFIFTENAATKWPTRSGCPKKQVFLQVNDRPCRTQIANRLPHTVRPKPVSRLLVSSRNSPKVRPLCSTGITRRHHYYEPVRHPKRPGLLLTEFRLRDTTSHRRGFPCCLLIPLSHMPSPLPRQDWSTFIAHGSTSGGLPQRTFGSALALSVSRIA